VNDGYWQTALIAANTFFAVPNINEQELSAFDDNEKYVLNNLIGYSPYPDPTTGFEESFRRRFTYLPTFAESKFYDGLLLAAFAACYREHYPAVGSINDAIIAITKGNGSHLDPAVWDDIEMASYLKSMEDGRLPAFRGAAGDIAFDAESYAPSSHTTYMQWQIHKYDNTQGGNYVSLGFFDDSGSQRLTNNLQAWKYLYNQEQAEADFANQSGQGADITYPALSDQYAVLVQGSNGWMDYRHEADVLNIYHMLKAGGYDDDHIILVSADECANAAENSDRGAVRTDPGGKNLREGAVIDYKNADLTPADIVNILKGEKTDKTPVVLPADAGQNVLLFWSGHGRSMSTNGVNEMAWRNELAGNGMTDELLSQTLQQMADQKQFRQMLVCLEPCYSANMGKAIEGIPGVLAICSAGAYEQSFADSWSNELGIWMCDRFSRNLVGHASANPDGTYRDLYLYCAQHTLGSHVGIYNYTNFGNLYTTSPKDFFVKRK
jgi:glycosylphosphatidylinositol transamidase (GPIT) subunit GPI8